MNLTEKAVLAIAIEYPDARAILFENCSSDSFSIEDNRIIFDHIKNLYDSHKSFEMLDIFDDLYPVIKGLQFCDFQDRLAGLPACLARQEIIENIKKIKEKQAERPLLNEIKEQSRAKRVDFESIKEIVDGAILRGSATLENPDPALCADDFVKWKAEDKGGITTGYFCFDSITDGFHPGEIISIIGRTTARKTFFAINILNNLSESTDKRVGFFSMEMARIVFWERVLQVNLNLSRQDLAARICGDPNLLEQDNAEILEKYKNISLYFGIYSAQQIKEFIKRDHLEIIFIDFLQLMKGKTRVSQYERVSSLMTEVKTLAKDEGVAIFLLVQLSREAGTGWSSVTIDMCRDSGTIEENSDFMIGLWDPMLRPEPSDKDKYNREKYELEFSGRIMVHLLKNKRGPIPRAKKLKINPLSGVIAEDT